MQVRAFAAFREAIGNGALVVEVPLDTTAGRVWEILKSANPRLQALPRPALFAVNGMFVEAATGLFEGDELGLLPPLSGGAADG